MKKVKLILALSSDIIHFRTEHQNNNKIVETSQIEASSTSDTPSYIM